MSFSKIVLARYNEDITWADKFGHKCLVYNKGLELKTNFSSVIQRSNNPNFGREGETYLYHIINNYDSLDEYTVFSQGDPFKHSPKFIEILEYLDNTNTWKNYQPLSVMWLPGSQRPPVTFIEYDRSCYVNNEYPVSMEILDDDMEQVCYPDYGIMPILEKFKYIHKLKITDKILPFITRELKLEDKVKTNFIKFNFGAIFGVHKNNILQHHKDFYRNLYEFVLKDRTHVYILERLWYTIFY